MGKKRPILALRNYAMAPKCFVCEKTGFVVDSLGSQCSFLSVGVMC